MLLKKSDELLALLSIIYNSVLHGVLIACGHSLQKAVQGAEIVTLRHLLADLCLHNVMINNLDTYISGRETCQLSDVFFLIHVNLFLSWQGSVKNRQLSLKGNSLFGSCSNF